MKSETGRLAIANKDLGADCVAHACMFFNRKDYDLASAEPPTLPSCHTMKWLMPCCETMVP